VAWVSAVIESAPVDPQDSLLSDVRRRPPSAAAIWGRRVGLAILVVIVVLGAVGFFGVHSRTVSSQGAEGYRLTVTYPQVARAGLDVPWRARVQHPGGVSEDVTLAISSAYFRMFETQGFYPDASEVTNDGTFVYFTFTKPPPGQDFLVDYDAYIQPSAQIGKSATVRLIIGGRLVAQTHLHTWLAP
jgi:hypothetical protein